MAWGGWTVITCINETTKLPDGTKCPAFALLVRMRPNQSSSSSPCHDMDTRGDGRTPLDVYLDKFKPSQGDEREAVLAIRGTTSTMDWSINLDEVPDSFLYYALASNRATQQNTSSSAPKKSSTSPDDGITSMGLVAVEGSVHRGMRRGALSILDSFAMRSCLTQLSLNGYTTTLVGHSLGGWPCYVRW